MYMQYAMHTINCKKDCPVARDWKDKAPEYWVHPQTRGD